MSKIEWDKAGERRYHVGVDHGVFYRRDKVTGVYNNGYAWNGLSAVTESPSGAEPTAIYADNMKYLNIMSVEEFAATIEAYTYPDEFGFADGTYEIAPGVMIGQQNRETFGFSYRTKIGNDILGDDAGYEIHLVYGCLAAPSERANNTINDSPDVSPMSWEVSTTAVAVGEVNGVQLRPTAHLKVSSLEAAPEDIAALEVILYGTAGTGDPEVGGVAPRMPFPEEFLTLFAA